MRGRSIARMSAGRAGEARGGPVSPQPGRDSGSRAHRADRVNPPTWLELIATLPPGFTVETRKLLDAVPAGIQERVEKDRNSRKKHELQWSGKTLSQCR